MIFTPLRLKGAYRIDLEPRGDARGFFARVFSAEEFAAHGLNTSWVHMNMSMSRSENTLRGLHFQRPPAAEVKMVRCLRGAVFDVMVDLRKGSTTYGQWEALELTAENRSMAYIPQGFAHGFQTLAPDTELFYWHSVAYSPSHEGGVRFDDPDLAVTWPHGPSEMSPRDLALPVLAQLDPIET